LTNKSGKRMSTRCAAFRRLGASQPPKGGTTTYLPLLVVKFL